MSHEYTPEVARTAVERGAAWLNEHCPDWVSHIKVERLDLGSHTFCVLGQTAKCLLGMPKPNSALRMGYHTVLESLGIDFIWWPSEHGFNVPCSAGADAESDYEVLTLTWREYIRERLAVQA